LNLRKEPVVLAASVVLVGLLVYPSLSEEARRDPTRRTTPPEVQRQNVPAVELALPQPRDLGEFDRDLFTRPRDTHPLPPLELEDPPLGLLPALSPPTEPPPQPSLYGRFLRADPTPKAVADLFVTDTGNEGLALSEDGDAPADASTPEAANGKSGALKALGYVQDKQTAPEALTPEQRAAELESNKRLYDWIRLDEGPPKFGWIRNPDRFGLRQRTAEEVQFLELDPKTGREVFAGNKPIPYARSRVTEFAFARTISNQIQEKKKEIGSEITTGQYTAVMAFADWCVEQRAQAREALAVAEEMYRLAQKVANDDPAPRLGVARCYEAGFQFEKAFEEYQALLDGGFAHRAEVHVRLAQLEARFRLFDSAEARLREAERIGRTAWEVQWALGRFLYERGRFAETLEHLELAHKFEPGPEQKAARAGIRLDLGASRVALGKLVESDGALPMFDQVLQVDPGNQRGLAGKLAASLLAANDRTGNKPGTSAALGVDVALARDQLGFELLVNQALAHLAKGQPKEARDELLAAADADPLRAYVAWRALSWIAEVTGYPGEAQRWIDRAWEVDPTDPWTLYQRGRVALQRDDPEGAERDLKAALDRELDFTDALVALADLNYRRARYDAAERYFERALFLDESRHEVHSRRALNFLRLNDLRQAEESFKRALALDRDDAVAKCGLAWTAYRKGNPTLAIELFAGLVDSRRTFPEDDPWRAFARGQMKRIQDHIAKEVWEDRFERLNLKNDWSTEEAAGPVVSLVKGEVVLQGNFSQTNGRVRVFREHAAPEFISLEMDVRVAAGTFARVGVFVSKEKILRGGESQTTAQISVERNSEGELQVLLMDRASSEPERQDIAPLGGVSWWPADKSVRLRIERSGEGSDATGRITVDGIPVAQGFPMRTIVSAGQVRVGVFAQGDTGRAVKLALDNVELVYKQPTK
jgi:tetratricopeptide (TPR) repeat protein